ncbi:MAG: radical SAM protein [Acholeplasmataceae bacterium]|nr:radical SAM protein [Acholeplasmataceae bacterium]
MKYKFCKNIRCEKVKNEYIVGDIFTGTIITLTKDGEKLIKHIQKNKDINDIEFLSNEQQELFSFLLSNNFIIEKNKEEKQINYLRTVYLHVNNVCNFSCHGCYSGSLRSGAFRFISNEETKILGEQLVSKGCKQVIVSGGEPMMSTNIYDVVKTLKEEGISFISLISNGFENTDKYLSMYDYVDNISFSLDGYSDTSSTIRPKSTVRKIKGLVKKLHDYEKNVSLIITIHHFNLRDIDLFIEMVDNLRVNFNFSVYLSFDDNDPFRLTKEDFYFLNDWIDKHSMHKYFEESNLAYKETCGLAKHICSIDQNLDVYPCHMMMREEYKLGSLKKDRLHSILSKPETIRLQTNFVFKNEECKMCEVKHFCGGGCIARSISEEKNKNTVDPLCKSYKCQISSYLESIF